MKLGIVGEQGSGKTTLFKMLTGQPTAPDFSLGKPNLGTICVPDKRLDFLATILKPKKITHSTIELIDPPGFTKSSYSFIRPTDALIYLIPFFGEFKKPVESLNKLNSELVLSDLEICKHAISKAKDSDGIELLNKCKTLLSTGDEIVPLRALELNESDEKFLRGFGLLSQKPAIVILNSDSVGSGASLRSPTYPGDKEITEFLTRNKLPFLNINAKLELEIAELAPEEQKAYRQEFGLRKSGLGKVIELIYPNLRLTTFFTVVGDEVKAWQIKEGAQAIQAAGLVHSDMERGFIKAEVINFEEFKSCESFKIAKEKGLLRLVNKEYIVKDGDIIEFRFNV